MIPEREIIESHFAGKIGRFLEFGANDGRTDSLTCGLVDAGWSGVQVEADPATFLRLCENHGRNSRLSLVNAAVGTQRGLHPFWSQCGDGHQESTLSLRHKGESELRGNSYHNEHWTNVATPWDILHAFGGPSGWDFLLIDVEGVSGDVLGRTPIGEMTDLSLICCESDTDPEIIMQLMAPWFRGVPAGVCNVIGTRV